MVLGALFAPLLGRCCRPSRVTKCVSGVCFYSILYFGTSHFATPLGTEWRGANDFIIYFSSPCAPPHVFSLPTSAPLLLLATLLIVLHRNSSAPAIMSSPPPTCMLHCIFCTLYVTSFGSLAPFSAFLNFTRVVPCDLSFASERHWRDVGLCSCNFLHILSGAFERLDRILPCSPRRTLHSASHYTLS